MTTVISRAYVNRNRWGFSGYDTRMFPFYSAILIAKSMDQLTDMAEKLHLHSDFYFAVYDDFILIHHYGSDDIRYILGINSGRRGGIRYNLNTPLLGTLLCSPTNYKIIPPQKGSVVKKDIQESMERFFKREINEL